MQSVAFSMEITVPSGHPEELRIVEIPQWSGIGFMFPRNERQKVVQMRGNELKKPGIYILWGQDDDGQDRVYIGETDSLDDRLKNHTDTFWNDTIVFTSRDGSINKAHVLFVESELVAIARKAGRCIVANVNDPQKSNLNETQRITAQIFLERLLLCLETVGVPFFRRLPENPTIKASQSPNTIAKTGGPPTVLLYLAGGQGRRQFDASGYVHGSEFIVFKGSRAAKENVRSASAQIRRNRAALVEDGYFIDRGNIYELVNDHVFSSPSSAGQAITGRACNGRAEWKTNEERPLSELEENS